jgi:hypothetical protein
MKNHRKFFGNLILILVFVVISSSICAASLLQKGNGDVVNIQSLNFGLSGDVDLMLEYIATREGVSEKDLYVINQHQMAYSELNRTFVYMKVLDVQTHKIYEAVMDLKNDQFVDIEAIEKENADRVYKKYGKLEPQLFNSLQTKTSREKVNVAIWFSSDIQKSNALEQLRTNYAQVPQNAVERPWLMVRNTELTETVREDYFRLIKRINLAQQETVGQWLNQQGYQVTYHPGIPSLTAKLPKNMILQIAERPEVERIYLMDDSLVPLLNFAIPSTRANAVWDMGFRGAGVRVAVLEADTIPLGHSSINVIAVRNPNPYYHASGVASAIGSHALLFPGMAPDAEIVSAGISGSGDNWGDVDDAILWAHDNYNVHIMNASFTSYTGERSDDMQWIDRVFDYYARYYQITMIAAAGNQSQGNHIGSPAKGYNVLAVGGTDDRRTVAWDDRMATFSSWKNPKRSNGSYGDREKPEVVASAYNLTLINESNQTYPGSGTSYSAPQVAGLAALLAQMNPALYESPEAMRAIIMATAWNNIEGPSGIPTGQDLKDGAGAIDASSAAITAVTGYADVYQYPYSSCQSPCWWSNYVYNSSPDPQTNFPVGAYRYYKFNVTKGERIRVALAWVSDPTGAGGNYGLDPLSTDLDLVIFDPNGSGPVPNGYSASHDNSYELVDFIAEKTGVYNVGVYKRSSSELINWIGLAWTRMHQVYLPRIIGGPGSNQAISSVPYPAPEDKYIPTNQELFVPYPAP